MTKGANGVWLTKQSKINSYLPRLIYCWSLTYIVSRILIHNQLHHDRLHELFLSMFVQLQIGLLSKIFLEIPQTILHCFALSSR